MSDDLHHRLEWLARNQVYTPPPLTEYPKRGRTFPRGYLAFFVIVLALCGLAIYGVTR